VALHSGQLGPAVAVTHREAIRLGLVCLSWKRPELLLRRERRHLDQVLAGRRVTRLSSRRVANRVAVVPR